MNKYSIRAPNEIDNYYSCLLLLFSTLNHFDWNFLSYRKKNLNLSRMISEFFTSRPLAVTWPGMRCRWNNEHESIIICQQNNSTQRTTAKGDCRRTPNWVFLPEKVPPRSSCLHLPLISTSLTWSNLCLSLSLPLSPHVEKKVQAREVIDKSS